MEYAKTSASHYTVVSIFMLKEKAWGLYLVKTQMTALGGKIEVESRVNEGTTFHLFFKKSHQPQTSL